MTFEEIQQLLQSEFNNLTLEVSNQESQAQINVPAQSMIEIIGFLKSNKSTFFDLLSCITGIDNGKEAGNIDIIYHLYSIPFEHALIIKTSIQRGTPPEHPPSIDSISAIYQSANWHEREIFDFFGVIFNHHPDLRRILLPNDWQGYPLRKDYKEQEYYRGIKVDNNFTSETNN
ncbi:MAG: NADH-quinone oxidoreductase subunit C [Cytophagales bacterium]|nr:MAG: NADH-quinone oxidoreductase subunit C [Cytophagales bacterium]